MREIRQHWHEVGSLSGRRVSDALGGADCLPRGVELLWPLVLRLELEIGSLDPSDVELAAAAHRSVFERLGDRGVRVLQRGVLANEADRNLVKETVVSERHKRERSAKVFRTRSAKKRNARNGQVLPHRQQLGATSDPGFGQHDLVQAEAVLEEVEEALVLQEEGDVVQGRDVVDSENLLVGNVAEHGNFGNDGEGERRRAAACDLESEANH